MEFVKMHGLGNDFIIVQTGSWEEAGDLQPYARMICDRNFGVGADGLVAIGKDPQMDIFMRIFNPDGSEAEMCGNAIRCVARYAYENGLVKEPNLSLRTLAGSRYPVVETSAGQVKNIKVDMGKPILKRSLIPVKGRGSNVKILLEASMGTIEATAVSMGNPHCIIFVDDINKIPVALWGAELEVHPFFPAKTNVEFVQILGRNEMIMRVFERGVGLTLACGTGACAALVAAVLNGFADRDARVHLPGGDLLIEWSQDDQHVYMTGPAEQVFQGSIDLQQIT